MAVSRHSLPPDSRVTASRPGFHLLAATFLLLLVGCATRETAQVPDPVPLAFPPPTPTPPAAFDPLLAGPWWQELGDPRLDAEVEKALTRNFSLQSAWARLAQARATARRARSSLWPSLSASASAETSERWGDDNSPAPDSYSASLLAAYEIDLWGRVRSLDQAAALDAAASAENLQAAAISLAAEVAATWMAIQETQGQLIINAEQIRVLQDTLGLIDIRFKRGQVDATDVLQQRRLVESRRGDRELLLARQAVLENALAVLVGDNPGQSAYAREGKLPELPALPPSGLPAEWVRRRPDVRAALLRVQAADARLAAAVADRYPALRLTGSVRAQDSELSNLFESWLGTLGANLTAPLFDAGSRSAEAARNRALVAAEFAAYADTLLSALEEVQNALARESRHAAYIDSLATQLELSRAAYRQTGIRYLRGAENYLRVLEAQQTLQNLERALLQARRERVEFRIALHRALAGPLEPPPPAAFPTYHDPLARPAE